jgi:hypothetical protein
MYKLYCRIFSVIVLCLFAVNVNASTDNNVIIRLTKSGQQPAFEYNTVQQLSAFIAEEIYAGRAKLWSSPNKELQIFPATLKDIEKANDMKLSEIDNLFIYEQWKEEKTKVEIVPIGFLFATRNKRNTDVTFGFVEYEDVKNVMGRSFAEVGIKNSSVTSFDEIIKQNKFVYSILQYGRQAVANNTLSEKIKNDVFNKKTIVYNKPVVNSRVVSFSIKRQADESIIKAENANLILNSVQGFMQANVEEYLSVGGDLIISHIDSEPNLIIINKMEVTGVWTKNITGIDFKPTGIILFINNTPLQFISIENVNRWNITPGLLTFEQFLINKNYYFNIDKINTKTISATQESSYHKLLEDGDWDKFEE